jgi:hypothetical protein
MITVFYIDKVKYKFDCEIKISTNLNNKHNNLYMNQYNQIYIDSYTIAIISNDLYLYQIMLDYFNNLKKFNVKINTYFKIYGYGVRINEIEQYDYTSNDKFKIELSCDYMECNKISLTKERNLKLKNILN